MCVRTVATAISFWSCCNYHSIFLRPLDAWLFQEREEGGGRRFQGQTSPCLVPPLLMISNTSQAFFLSHEIRAGQCIQRPVRWKSLDSLVLEAGCTCIITFQAKFPTGERILRAAPKFTMAKTFKALRRNSGHSHWRFCTHTARSSTQMVILPVFPSFRCQLLG